MKRPTAQDAAFAEFVTARQTRLRRAAYAICGSWDLADDLLQIAFVKFYVAWPRLRSPNAAEAYTRQILVRSNIDESRRPWRREHPAVLDIEPAAAADNRLEDRHALVEALQALSLMQRKVVVLRHLLDLSVSQTADELGISEGTVKSHASRGLSALASVLEKAPAD